MLAPWKERYDPPRQHIKKQRHYFANKVPSSQSYAFFPVVMCGYESWTIEKSEVTQLCPTLFDPMDYSLLGSTSMGFSRQEYWSGLPFSSPRWMPKIWCFWTVVFEKTLEIPLDCKEIKPVNPKGLMLKLKLLILWPPDAKNWCTGKYLDAGKDWMQ